MARVPIEIVKITENFEFNSELNQAIEVANSLQNDFLFQFLSDSDSSQFSLLSFNIQVKRI